MRKGKQEYIGVNSRGAPESMWKTTEKSILLKRINQSSVSQPPGGPDLDCEEESRC